MNYRKDYFWNTLGVFLQNALSPILLLIVTRLNGIELSGVFSFAFSLSLLLWAFGMWGGRTYQVSDTQTEFEHRSYVMVRLVLAVGMLLIAGFFCEINHYNSFKTALVFGLVVFKILESFGDVLYGILQVHNTLYKSGRSLTLKAIVGVVAFFIIDVTTKNIIWSIFGVIVVNSIVLLAYDFVQANRFESIRFPISNLRMYLNEAKKIMRRCGSVFVVFFLAMFSLNIPRYFIDLNSEKEVGVFGIMAMPITLIVLLISFILQPNIVQLAGLWKNKKISAFSIITAKITKLSLVVGILVLIISALMGTSLLHSVFDVNFTQYQWSLVMIVAGGVASAIVTVYLNIFVIMRRLSVALTTLIVTNIILIPVSYYAVKSIGLAGGVMSFAVTNILQLIVLYGYYLLMMKRSSGEKS